MKHNGGSKDLLISADLLHNRLYRYIPCRAQRTKKKGAPPYRRRPPFLLLMHHLFGFVNVQIHLWVRDGDSGIIKGELYIFSEIELHTPVITGFNPWAHIKVHT